MKKNRLFLLLPIAYLAFCTILLTLPGQTFPRKKWFTAISLDKWIHISMFLLMVVTICWAFSKMKEQGINWRLIIWTGIACLCYGVVIEYVQLYFVTNRSFDVRDIFADGTGSVIGAIISRRAYRKK